ncbi:MAG: hypothetical protein CMC11_05475 [Flavobacteriaceae bacterium]|jgi:uncharacterized membrane protein YgdD (TMEM256/DUF423 family)|nr:hypothetical protein [Flavobacteriaceae bacterium]|tara:strand:+ start:535 stop:915 length:381 start_codon:yes stop_codon:yes gene_type:complete
MLYITEIIGTVFCLLSVILGAFGSHYLKNKMTQTEIQSFEIGVKYLIYHGLSLLIISQLYLDITIWISVLITVGTILFSFSIFFLSTQTLFNKNLKILGPITPLGGLLIIIGWFLLLLEFLATYLN